MLLGKTQGLIGAAIELNHRGAAEGGIQKDIIRSVRLSVIGRRRFLCLFRKRSIRGTLLFRKNGLLLNYNRGSGFGGGGDFRNFFHIRQLTFNGQVAVAVETGKGLRKLQPPFPTGEGIGKPKVHFLKIASGNQSLQAEFRELCQLPFFFIGNSRPQWYDGGDKGDQRQNQEKGKHRFDAFFFRAVILLHRIPQN